MKIRNTILIGVIGLLLLIMTWASLSVLAVRAERVRARSGDQLVSSLRLAEQLRRSSDDLTRMARLYVSTGDGKYRDYFLRILSIRNGSQPRPADYGGVYWDRVLSGETSLLADDEAGDGERVALRGLMQRMGFTKEEFALLAEAEDNSNDLVQLEDTAMNAVVGRFQDEQGEFTINGPPDLEMARSIMFGARYHDAKEKILEPIYRFNREIEGRLRGEIKASHLHSLRLANWQVLVALLTSVAMLVGLFHLRTVVLEPLKQLTRDADALRHQHYSTRVQILRDDEIGELGRTFNGMAEAISEDIENREQVAVELRKARDGAEQAARTKSEFLANMSHEIRTPMNGIMGMSELLLDTELTESQREYAGLIDLSAQSLLTVINDILDFSKIEAGKMTLDFHEFDLRDCIGDTLQTLGFRAADKGLELAYQVESNVPDCLIGDLGRVRQVLINLVSNAIKFTSMGEVVVDVQLESQTKDQASLHFLVRDTGIGISPEKQEAVFESFVQAESSTTRGYGGMGLGLTISQSLIELMKGRIWVESVLDEGSTFHFTALFDIGSERPDNLPSSLETLHSLPVLVVDDNETNRKILRQMLLNWEMAPQTAAGGHEALEMLAAGVKSDARFELVILDVMMPEMDGLEVARQIASTYGDDVPGILVLSSAAEPLAPEDAARLCIERVFTKPVKQSDLLDAITRLFGTSTRDRPSDGSAQSVGPLSVLPMHVLLAEDGRVNRMVAIKLLEQRGHSVALANDGQAAVDMHAVVQYDAILMDIQMPGMDGYAATQAIRGRERSRDLGEHIAIIAMTANAMKGDRERCLSEGMDDYLPKPVRSAELYSVLEKYGRSKTDGNDATAKRGSVPDADRLVDRDDRATFDAEDFHERTGGDVDLMGQLIDVFSEEIDGFLEQGRQAIAAEDGEALHTAAHSLKGTLGTYSSKRAHRSAVVLDGLARNGDLDGALGALQDCEQAVEQLRGALLEFRRSLS